MSPYEKIQFRSKLLIDSRCAACCQHQGCSMWYNNQGKIGNLLKVATIFMILKSTQVF